MHQNCSKTVFKNYPCLVALRFEEIILCHLLCPDMVNSSFLIFLSIFKAFEPLITWFAHFLLCWTLLILVDSGSSVLKRLHQNYSKIAPKNIMSNFFFIFDKHSFHTFQCTFYNFRFLLYHIIFYLCSLFTNKICILLILVVWWYLNSYCFMFTVLVLFTFFLQCFYLFHLPFLIISL